MDEKVCLTLIAISARMKSKRRQNVEDDFRFYMEFIPNFSQNYKKITKDKEFLISEKNVVMKQIVTQWITDNLKKYPTCRLAIKEWNSQF
jgi:hypothetical protein